MTTNCSLLYCFFSLAIENNLIVVTILAKIKLLMMFKNVIV